MHAMVRDIADHCTLYGQKLDEHSWKRLLIDAFRWDTKDDPAYAQDWGRFGDIQLLPALNHPGIVMVGEQSRKFSMRLMAGFITWLTAYGNQAGVVWKDPKWRAEMARMGVVIEEGA